MATNRSTRTDQYRIFLLTFWLEDAGTLGDPESWRFRLEDPRTGERRGCVALSALVALLKDEIVDEVLSKKHETD